MTATAATAATATAGSCETRGAFQTGSTAFACKKARTGRKADRGVVDVSMRCEIWESAGESMNWNTTNGCGKCTYIYIFIANVVCFMCLS